MLRSILTRTPTLPEYITIGGREFDDRQWSDEGLDIGYYRLHDDGGVLMFWAYVPDGVGGFYYPTLEEAFQNHG